MRYDNIGDAKQKLSGTYCYYKGQAVVVREVNQRLSDTNPEEIETFIRLTPFGSGNQKQFTINILDPDFRYMEFNVGYINGGGYALWYYRLPLRQYSQGLKRNQMHIRDKSRIVSSFSNFDYFSNNFETANMMENKYPTFEEAVKQLDSTGMLKVAFHKDFAVFRDPMRKDFVIEHKGIPAAFGDLKELFRCTDNMQYIRESIRELNIKVA